MFAPSLSKKKTQKNPEISGFRHPGIFEENIRDPVLNKTKNLKFISKIYQKLFGCEDDLQF